MNTNRTSDQITISAINSVRGAFDAARDEMLSESSIDLEHVSNVHFQLSVDADDAHEDERATFVAAFVAEALYQQRQIAESQGDIPGPGEELVFELFDRAGVIEKRVSAARFAALERLAALNA